MTTVQEESRELHTTLARLNARAWGIAMGLLLGGVLFLATIILIMRGGPNVGQHLALLRAYFPGYSVTVPGSFIGFIYGFVLGYALGRVIGMVYNRVVTVSK
jgi:hypothetical protein